MRVLLSNSPASILRHLPADVFAARYGLLVTPSRLQPVKKGTRLGAPWALDNAAFAGFVAHEFEAALAFYRDETPPLFVVVPDVVADARATRALWDVWAHRIAGYPLAYVLQDGQPAQDVPWDECAALFVGGTTAYKLGEAAYRLVLEGKARGKHIHMGRVNTQRRLNYAQSHGIDTVDGTGFAKFQRASLRLSERVLGNMQLKLEATECL